MAKAAKKTNKPKSKKAVSKYHEKFKVNGSFDEVMSILAKPVKPPKK